MVRVHNIYYTRLACPPAPTGYTSGKWVHEPDLSQIHQITGLDMSYVPAGETRRNSSRYFWKPQEPCNLLPFDAPTVCRLLEGHSILFVGDSLTANSVEALRRQFKMTGKTGHTGLGYVHSTSVCGGRSQIDYIRNDYLSFITEPMPVQHLGTMSYAWVVPSILQKYEYLILNTGAHSIAIEEYKDHMSKLSNFLALNYSGKVVFRSTVRPLYQCMGFAGPLDESQYETLLHQPGHLEPAKYHWKWFDIYNDIAYSSFSQQYLSEEWFTYIDVNSFSKLRPDAHYSDSDCLHFTLPGVPDIWVQILYNHLVGRIS